MIVIIRHGNSGAGRKWRFKTVSSSISQEKTIICWNGRLSEKGHFFCNLVWVVLSTVHFHPANLTSKRTQNKGVHMQVGKSVSRKPTHSKTSCLQRKIHLNPVGVLEELTRHTDQLIQKEIHSTTEDLEWKHLDHAGIFWPQVCDACSTLQVDLRTRL